DPEVVRCFLISTHYRSPIEFSDAQLNEAEISIDRYYSTVMRIQDFIEALSNSAPFIETAGNAKETSALNEFENLLFSTRGKFEDAMNDDFNSALAIGSIFELIRETNRFLDAQNPPIPPLAKGGKEGGKELVLKAKEMLAELGGVLNIFQRTPEEWYKALMKVKNIGLTEKDIIDKISERQEARQKKDWALADKIRKELDEKGIILEDKKDRTTWRVKIGQ
ncbi:MAG: hypothetical protein Q8N09_06160, partial [Thermodesulfovibrionia bacterium]|nr:hypothetical protein [Thermodesulfovibrionia bacterium]